jgi:hypothetical protein
MDIVEDACCFLDIATRKGIADEIEEVALTTDLLSTVK